MSITEVKILEQNWDELSREAVKAEKNDFKSIITSLRNVINNSPTLIEHAFDRALYDVERYKPNPQQPSKPDPTEGVAPVQNEIIRIGDIIREILQTGPKK